ncbi:MAG TPA: DNA methyltransferase [Pirellulales bacterium]|nr:DNA methyltransferase [Pirellulales bacterium]
MRDPEQYAHLEWLGYVQPVGLVVSIPALLQAQAYVNRNIAPDQQRFLATLPRDKRDEPVPEIRDFPAFAQAVLGWEPSDLVDLSRDEAARASLEVAVPEYSETLRPTYAVRESPVPVTPTRGASKAPTPTRGASKEPTPTRSASKEPVTPTRGASKAPATSPWLMLVQVLPTGTDFDEVGDMDQRHWQTSPQAKFERLLRETEVPIGLSLNGTQLRLVYAPRGETSGHITFPVAATCQVAGRPIFAALVMLLSAERLYSVAPKQRLPAILADSRKYQNVVSTKLAAQVLAALYELLRGFQAANDASCGELLKELLATNNQQLATAPASDPNHVYAGLLTVLMRLVFVLYAEDRGLLSADSVFTNFYSLTGLFDRLRADAGRFPDTMDQRYGAWAQLLTLFRLVYDGGGHGDLRIPGRKGYLFDPDRYPFLEGRPWKSCRRDQVERLDVPRVSDGVIYRVLANLLVLDGERLSYRTLDVEQIGSVYETIMGFNLEVAHGRSIAIKPAKPHGAPATINLEALLAAKPAERAKWLADQSDQKLTGQAAEAVKGAESIDDLLAALEKKIAWHATPHAVPKGAMVLQPSGERRRSGSHYTPRSLTEPIVRTTLRPVLEQLTLTRSASKAATPTRSASKEPAAEAAADSAALLALRVSVAAGSTAAASADHSPLTSHHSPVSPTPDQILNLKICDPAMGSGAFLVETCRQLGDELVKAWHVHNQVPKLPPDEDEVLHARRLVAQRCLYGVDRNPMAVDLAKLSLWLATLAKDHPFTFLDHSLRAGDSLVGLTREQIAGFHWKPTAQMHLLETDLKRQIETATTARRRILEGRDDAAYEEHERALSVADEALDRLRLVGDLVIAAWFGAEKDKEREKLRKEYLTHVEHARGPGKDAHELRRWLEIVRGLRTAAKPIVPFHWEIEFPEVFNRSPPATSNSQPATAAGFDAIVGNPPFAGRTTFSASSPVGYVEWLKILHEGSHGNSDGVAHFFRRSFELLRQSGAFGLIATNTIAQGDTRSTGLRWICTHGGTIYAARKRYKWPGLAAVMVSVVHICKGDHSGPYVLDVRQVPIVTAYLFHKGGHDDPQALIANQQKSFQGCVVVGMGFTFDDSERNGVANPIALMKHLVERNPRNAERVFPYIGGEEFNDSAEHKHHRYVINFGEMDEDECRRNWPDLMRIVVEKVKPERIASGIGAGADRRKRGQFWWRFSRTAKDLYDSIRALDRVLVTARTSKHLGFAFIDARVVPSENLVVFPIRSIGAFAVLQSRAHGAWVNFTSSTFKDDQGYRPSDCFETFPFPTGTLECAASDSPATDNRQLATLEAAGRAYYEFRAALMVRNDEGLTKTYNRFHDPAETSAEIARLRELHAAIDRAVLDAYGWHDLAQTSACEFLLDYEDEDDEEEPDGRRSSRGRKKPWRYRWPDEFRDEVLARLLALNAERAEEERLAGIAAEAEVKPKRRGSKKKPATRTPANASDDELF